MKKIVCKKATGRGRGGQSYSSREENKDHPAYNAKKPKRQPDYENDLFEFFLEEGIVVVVHEPCLLSFCPVTNQAMYMTKHGHTPTWVLIHQKISKEVSDLIVEKAVLSK